MSRLGLDNYGELIIKSIFVSFLLIYSPHFIKEIVLNKVSKEWYLSKAFLIFVVMMILVFLGRISLFLDVDFSYTIAFLGGMVFFISIFSGRKEGNFRNIIALSFLFILFGVWIIAAYCSKHYYHPLISEKIITGAYAHREAIFHASISGMFKTYGVSSTGLDGLVPLYYHTFAHFIFGSISGLLDISSIIFINLCVPIIFIPLFFYLFILCTINISSYFSLTLGYRSISENDVKIWLTLFCMFAFVFPQKLLPESIHYIVSPSYFMALLLTFIFISIVFSYLYVNYQITNYSLIKDYSFVAIMVILYLFISYTKISFLYIIGVLYLYIFIRFKLYNYLTHFLLLMGIISVSIYMYYKTIVPLQDSPHQSFNPSGPINIPGNIFLTYYINELVRYPFYIYPSLLFIGLKLCCKKINSFPSLMSMIKNREIIDIELLVLLIFISFIPPYDYFKGIQIYIAYLLILSHQNLFFDSFENLVKKLSLLFSKLINKINSNESVSISFGILLIIMGVVLNEYLLTLLFSDDGILENSTKYYIIIFQIFLISVGLMIILFKSFRLIIFKLANMAQRNIYIIIVFCFFYFLIQNPLKNSYSHVIVFVSQNFAIRESFSFNNNVFSKGTHWGGEKFRSTVSKNNRILVDQGIIGLKNLYNNYKQIFYDSSKFFNEYNIVTLLFNLSDKPNSFKKTSAIYIPHTLTSYWDMSCDSHMPPFIVPAIANIAMINGLPPLISDKKSCYTHELDYGFPEYYKRGKKAQMFSMEKNDLCVKAQQDGFKRVIEFTQDSTGNITTIHHECE